MLKVQDRGRCTATLAEHAWIVYCVAVMPDGLHAVSGSWDKTLKVWDLGTGACRLPGAHAHGVAVTPDGRHAVSVGSMELKVWDLGTGRCTTSLTTGYVYHCIPGVCHARWSACGL